MAYDTHSFAIPPEYQAQLSELERRKAIQDALVAQTFQSPQTQMTGGRYSQAVPYSPLQGATKLIQSAMLGKQMKDTDKRTQALMAQAQQADADAAKRVLAQGMGGQAPYEVSKAEMFPSETPSTLSGQATAGMQTQYQPNMDQAILQGYSSPHQGAQRVAEAMAAIRPEPQKPMVVGKGGALVSQQGSELYRSPYGGPDTEVNVNTGMDEFAKKFAGGQSNTYFEMEAGAQSAYEGKIAMDQFLENSDTATAGSAQPLFTMLKNLMASAGMESESLVSEQVMAQALNSRMSQYMKELGARGLTDADMKILAKALPQINTSKAARDKIAGILKDAYDKKLSQFSNRYNETIKNNPKVRPYAYKPMWLIDWEAEQAELTEVEEVNKMLDGSQYGKVPARIMR